MCCNECLAHEQENDARSLNPINSNILIICSSVRCHVFLAVAVVCCSDDVMGTRLYKASICVTLQLNFNIVIHSDV